MSKVGNLRSGDKAQDIDVFHYHEISDRCHIINSLIDDFILDHPACTAQMNSHAVRAQNLLTAVMNEADKEEGMLRGTASSWRVNCCNADCGWAGLSTDCVHQPHSPKMLLCPECHEVVEPVYP